MQTLIEKLESVMKVKKTPSPGEKELFQKTQDFVKLIGWIPGLRMVAVSNSLAMYATHAGSDIDLFIITAPRRLWIVRTLVLLSSTILGVRTKPGHEAGQFCFPFFMTEKNLSLQNIALQDTIPENSQKQSNLNEERASEGDVQSKYVEGRAEGGVQRTSFSGFSDVYLAYWILTLKPIYNQYYTYGRFMEINQVFCDNTLQYTPSAEDRANILMNNRMFLVPTRRYSWATGIGNILSPLLSFTDNILGFISRQIIKRKIPTAGAEGIVVNNDMVKLHFTDRRRVIQERVLQDS